MKATPKLLGVSTAVPKYKFDQDKGAEFIHRVYSGPRDVLDKMLPIYQNSGISMRYSCVSWEWYENSGGWAEKNKLFLENSQRLPILASVVQGRDIRFGSGFQHCPR